MAVPRLKPKPKTTAKTKTAKPKPTGVNPIMQMAMITPEVESALAAEMTNEIDTLSDISVQLAQARKAAIYEARIKDLKHLQNMDTFIDTVLETLVEEKKSLKLSIKHMLKKKDMNGLHKLMIAMKMTQEAREQLLGFDETRVQNKQRMKLQVIWKDAQGGTGGVSLETQ